LITDGDPERVSDAGGTTEAAEFPRPFLQFFLPLAGVVVLYVVYFVVLSVEKASKLLAASVAYTFVIPPFDKNTLILGAIHFGIEPYEMALNLAILDSLLGTFLCLNFDYAIKIPWIGPMMRDFENGGRRILEKHAWLNRFTLLGLTLFIVLPFQGSGSLAGAIVGRMIGLHKVKVIFAIIFGTFAGVFALAYLADKIVDVFPYWVSVAVPSVIAALIIVGVVYRYTKKRCPTGGFDGQG